MKKLFLHIIVTDHADYKIQINCKKFHTLILRNIEIFLYQYRLKPVHYLKYTLLSGYKARLKKINCFRPTILETSLMGLFTFEPYYCYLTML